MGLTLEFYMGDPTTIGPAVADVDFDVLDDSSVVQERADLSLHIQPKDLDTLSREAAVLLQREPVLLQQSLGEAIGGNESDHGAFLVAPEWVAQIGALQPDAASELTRRWMTAMAKEYDDPEIQVTPPAEAAVSSLIALCRRANQSSSPVVHAWFL
jgi:hypothetical protein